jgi:hypothetical protein
VTIPEVIHTQVVSTTEPRKRYFLRFSINLSGKHQIGAVECLRSPKVND